MASFTVRKPHLSHREKVGYGWTRDLASTFTFEHRRQSVKTTVIYRRPLRDESSQREGQETGLAWNRNRVQLH